MSITQLQKAKRNQYGGLEVDFEATIGTAYPKLKFKYEPPGCWGGNPDIYLNKYRGEWTLCIPDGKYKSNKHYHTSGHDILAIETARNNKLNLNKRPLFLLKGWIFNGDYRSLTQGYWIFGQNEDNSYFAHRIRPRAAENFSLDECRSWMWELRSKETIACRQGDLAFIPKASPRGELLEEKSLAIGNHQIDAEQIKQTKHRLYAFNPVATHHEHDTVQSLDGWFEMRLAKIWQSEKGD